MPYGIETVTVIGAGTMGAAIAGHLANAGVRAWLLDIVPSELTAEETAAGLTLADRKVRNRIVQAGYERMVKAKPANLFTQSAASLVSVGNLEDDFDAAVGAERLDHRSDHRAPRPQAGVDGAHREGR
jgi:3-hydroxyacyl-CoA dehydrogenase